MPFRIIIQLILIPLAIMSTAGEVSARDRLVFNTAALAPYHTPEQTGFIDAVLQQALGRIGLDITINALPAERAILNANSGIDDGDALRVAGMEKIYPNLVRVPEAIGEMRFVAFSRKADFSTSAWDSLKPYSVGLINGWKIYERNVTEAKQINRVKNVKQLFNLLAYDRADVVLYGEWQGLAYLNENGLAGVKILQPAFSRNDMYLYVHARHRDLVPGIAAALRDMKADGSYQRIVERILLPLARSNQ